MAATSLNTGRGRFALLQSCDGVADRDESPVARAGDAEVMRGPMGVAGVAGTTVVMAACLELHAPRVWDPRRVWASGVWGIHGGDGIAASVITSALIYSQHATLEKGSTRSLQPNELSILVSVYEGQTTSGAF